MDESNNELKNIAKKTFKVGGKYIIIILLVLLIPFIAIMSSYLIFKDTFIELSKLVTAYQSNPAELQDPTTFLEKAVNNMASLISPELNIYIDGDDAYRLQQVKYLVGAELVTKYPYIEANKNKKIDSKDPYALNGIVKFYRYKTKDEAAQAYNDKGELNTTYQLQYVNEKKFQEEISNYTEEKRLVVAGGCIQTFYNRSTGKCINSL